MSDKKDKVTQKWEQLELLDTDWKRYIECGDGWLDLIDRCLQELYDYKIAHNAKFKVQCIKEKFGGIRIHLSQFDDDLWAIIQKYEEEASRTCEDCGIVADNVKVKTVNRGWLKCCCDDCKFIAEARYKS